MQNKLFVQLNKCLETEQKLQEVRLKSTFISKRKNLGEFLRNQKNNLASNGKSVIFYLC